MLPIMNKLSFEKRRQILHMMVEGNSIRGIARLVDVSPVTVLRYLELAGAACAIFPDEKGRGVKAPPGEGDQNLRCNYFKPAHLAQAKTPPRSPGRAWTSTGA